MGYACPVCEIPQRDAEHLANHLAFTAILRGDGHESWLDERIHDWGDMRPTDLAPEVAERAEEAPYREVFEDTVERHGGEHDGDRESPFGEEAGRESVPGTGGGSAGTGALPSTAPNDSTVQEVFAEARELTRRMHADDSADEHGDAGEPDEGDELDEGNTTDDAADPRTEG